MEEWAKTVSDLNEPDRPQWSRPAIRDLPVNHDTWSNTAGPSDGTTNPTNPV